MNSMKKVSIRIRHVIMICTKHLLSSVTACCKCYILVSLNYLKASVSKCSASIDIRRLNLNVLR